MEADQAQLDERVRGALDATGLPYEVLPCEEHLADTETFSNHYGFPTVSYTHLTLPTTPYV